MFRSYRTLVAAMLLLMLAGAPLRAPAQNESTSSPESVGGVADLQGVAEAERDAPEPLVLALQDAVYRADLLRTHSDSYLTVSLDDGSWFSMDADTVARMEDYVAGQDALLTMAKGRLRVFVSDTFSRYDNAFRVQTDDAVIGVQGTFFIVTRLIAETTLYVIQGIVSVTSTDPRYPDPVIAQAGQFVRVPANAPPSTPVTIDQNFNFGQSTDPYGTAGPYWGRTLPPGFVVPIPVPLPGTGSGLVNRAIIQGTTPPPPPPPPARPVPAPAAGAGAAAPAAPAAPAGRAAPAAGGAAAPAAAGAAPAGGRPAPPAAGGAAPAAGGAAAPGVAAPPPALPANRPGPPAVVAPGKQDAAELAPQADPSQDPAGSDADNKPPEG